MKDQAAATTHPGDPGAAQAEAKAERCDPPGALDDLGPDVGWLGASASEAPPSARYLTARGDLRGLEHFPRACYLDVGGAVPEGDFAYLSAGRSLIRLHLTSTRIPDFTHLSSMTGLRVLFVLDDSIPSLEGLGALRELRELTLLGVRSETRRTSFAVWVNLESLRVAKLEQADLDDLAHLPRLRRLDITVGHPVDISPLAAVPTLRELRIRGHSPGDVTGLTALSQLKTLGVGPIRDLSPLARLPHLRSLSVTVAGKGDLSGLVGAPALEELDFYCTHEECEVDEAMVESLCRVPHLARMKGDFNFIGSALERLLACKPGLERS